MINKEKEMKSDNFYLLANLHQKKKIEKNKDKKKSGAKSNTNFTKITSVGNINTSGNQPIVVFKKNSTKKCKSDLNNIQKQKNEYISDGGLNQKIQKYNININNNNVYDLNNINNIYFNNFINVKNQNIPNNKNKNNNCDSKPSNNNTNNNTKKVKEQQHIMSKTVRDFNKRPLIQKTEKSKDINQIDTKNSNGTKKIKNKSVNLNNNNIGTNNIKNNQNLKKNNSEDSKVQEEKKLIIMKQLVENGVVNEIKK